MPQSLKKINHLSNTIHSLIPLPSYLGILKSLKEDLPISFTRAHLSSKGGNLRFKSVYIHCIFYDIESLIGTTFVLFYLIYNLCHHELGRTCIKAHNTKLLVHKVPKNLNLCGKAWFKTLGIFQVFQGCVACE